MREKLSIYPRYTPYRLVQYPLYRIGGYTELMDDEPHHRLRAARVAAGYETASAAARAFGWPEGAYRHHENATRRFGSDHARSYGRAFRVKAGWLLGLEDKFEPDFLENLLNDLNDDEGPSGSERDLDESLRLDTSQLLLRHFQIRDFDSVHTEFPSTFPQKWKAFDVVTAERMAKIKPSLLCAIFAEDATMSPLINDGASLVIDVGAKEIDRQDAVWLLSYGARAMIRRIRVLPDDRLELTAEGQNIRAIVDHKDAVSVRGRVVWIGQPI